jgi:hypothetical protein
MSRFSSVLLFTVYTIVVGVIGYRLGSQQRITLCVSKCKLALNAMNIIWPLTSKITFVVGDAPCENICKMIQLKDSTTFDNVKEFHQKYIANRIFNDTGTNILSLRQRIFNWRLNKTNEL